jgi:aryl-alcohol dehydrogenase-like predicted oxidoreductase
LQEVNSMQLRALGNSGLLVSIVGLGTNNFGMRDDVEAAPVVHRALDLGITLFDTAASYGDGRSERALGEALGERRKDVVIATKWGGGAPPVPGVTPPEARGGSRDHIMKSVERSLRNLRTDYIDLYQYHRPDPKTPIEETLRALDDLVHQGKVRYLGVSNMPAWQVVRAQWTARHLGLNRFIACQDGYSLLNRAVVEPDLVNVMQSEGIGLLPYFPLAGGMLTGKYQRGENFPRGSRFAAMGRFSSMFTTDRNWDLVRQLSEFARTRGRTVTELAFSWLAAQSFVASVIAGATRAGQVEENVAAVGWTLTADELAEIDRITGKPAPASPFG